MIHPVVAALVLAVISTAGDFVWANFRVRHLMAYGIAHGVLMFLVAGVLVVPDPKQRLFGALGGIAAGGGGALAFYALRPLLGYGGMFASWILVWVILGYVARAGLARGVLAALLSGAAFYAVSGMWMPFNPATPLDYAEHFVRWTVAFSPGFAALMLGRRT